MYLDNILKALEFLDQSSTYIVPLKSNDNENDWAIVFGYIDDYEDKIPRINGKVAYQPKNSLMKEYDIDWIMPYNKDTSEVDDTETTIACKEDIEYLIHEWERIKNEKEI